MTFNESWVVPHLISGVGILCVNPRFLTTEVAWNLGIYNTEFQFLQYECIEMLISMILSHIQLLKQYKMQIEHGNVQPVNEPPHPDITIFILSAKTAIKHPIFND